MTQPISAFPYIVNYTRSVHVLSQSFCTYVFAFVRNKTFSVLFTTIINVQTCDSLLLSAAIFCSYRLAVCRFGNLVPIGVIK